MARVIGREELHAKIERGDDFVLIETLSARDHAAGHLPGALSLPWNEIRQRAHEVIPDRDAEVVVYCHSRTCDAATKAILALEELGYTGLLYYLDGKADWKAAGLPLETPGSLA